MIKLSRDEQLYQLIKPVIDKFRFEDSKPGEDIESILRSKIRYDSLRQKVSWVDEDLLTKKDRIRELISAKEESALYDLGFLDIAIAENPVLNRRLADIGLSRIHDKKEKRRLGKLWAKGQRSTGTLFFDDSLTEERTNRTVKRKDGKTYQRSGTKEAILNDRLRQLSDAVHPDIEGIVNDLREAYVDVTGMEAKNYKIPGTTYLRESVVLRTKIGKALVKKEDLASDFRNADPHYQYRFLADRWLKQRENSGFVLEDFLQKQLNLLTGEKAVLASYKEVVQRLKQNGKITGDIEVSDKLSVYDQIQQYRKALSGNVYDIAGIMPSSSPAYLDLVESKKKTDFSLYKSTAKELSKDLGLWDKKTEQLINKNVPLSAWKGISEEIKQSQTLRREKLFSSETSLEDFRKLWEDRAYRNSVSWTVVKNKEGREIRVPEGITRFAGRYYRTKQDKVQLQQDFDLAADNSRKEIEKAKQIIVDIKEKRIRDLEESLSVAKQAGQNTGTLEKRIAAKKQQLDSFKSYDHAVSIPYFSDYQLVVIKRTADILSAEATVLQQDPAFNFKDQLVDVPSSQRAEALLQHSERLKNVKASVDQWAQKISAPEKVLRQSLDEQLSWYKKADELISEIESKDYTAFSLMVEKEGYQELKKRLPVGYLTRVKGKVYRTEADKEIYTKFKDEHERFIAREQRILEGPVRQDSVKTLNSFGALLQQKQTSSDIMSTIAAVKESSNFSEAYKGLSEQQKKLYDYNYGKPVEAKGVFYHSVYDIPDKIWEEEEKAAGFSKPRQRGQAVVNYDINVAQEEELQKKITEDLKNRSWESPVKEKTVSKALTESVSEQQFLEQEARENLEKMLSVSREKSKTVKLGGMGVMAAFALFNIAMTGPSREAEEHKRRVEEERKRKMYGY